MPWAAIAIPAAAAVTSGVLNYAAQSSANDRAKMIQDQAFQQWMSLNIPDPAEQKIALEEFVSQGRLSPVMQAAIQQDPSAFQGIVTDAHQKAVQNNALSQLEDIGNSGGLRLQDRAALQDAQLEAQQQARGNRDAVAANMARRGLSGSGFDVAAQLQGQQGEADQNARSTLQVAANAQDRALKAIEGAGTLAGQQRSQDFGEKAQKAAAADRISQFNTQNARDVNAANTGMANRDQELNLGNAQRIADQNTQLSNSQQIYNKQLAQQQYQNQLQKVAGATGQANVLGGTEQRGGTLAGNAFTNIGTAASNAGTAYATNQFWNQYFDDQKAKRNQGNGYYSNGEGYGSED